jgi:hypothetical protein
MSELSNLPRDQRAARYRALADDADRFAASVKSQAAQHAYGLMARQWRLMADEAEAAEKRLREGI